TLVDSRRPRVAPFRYSSRYSLTVCSDGWTYEPAPTSFRIRDSSFRASFSLSKVRVSCCLLPFSSTPMSITRRYRTRPPLRWILRMGSAMGVLLPAEHSCASNFDAQLVCDESDGTVKRGADDAVEAVVR